MKKFSEFTPAKDYTTFVLTSKMTGLKHTVVIKRMLVPNSRALNNSPRVFVKFNEKEIPITISYSPQNINGDHIPEKDFAQIKKWITTNKTTLLDYWNNKIKFDTDLTDKLITI